MFSATAARISAFSAFSSILSPSWKSMARLVLPSRLELKRAEGSSNEARSEEHTSELQSLTNLVCRLLLEKKKNKQKPPKRQTTKPNTKARHEETLDAL